MKLINIILLGFLLVFGIWLHKEVTSETPNERAERINRNADRECGKYQDLMARNCYAWYYGQIEDRN